MWMLTIELQTFEYAPYCDNHYIRKEIQVITLIILQINYQKNDNHANEHSTST